MRRHTVDLRRQPDVAEIVALCRFAEMRCPSEVFRLKWSGINHEQPEKDRGDGTPCDKEFRRLLSGLGLPSPDAPLTLRGFEPRSTP